MKKYIILFLIVVVLVGCSNREIKNDSFKEQKKELERMNYNIQVPLEAREISYSIGSGEYIEKERFALSRKGVFVNIEVRPEKVQDMEYYIRRDLEPIINNIHVLKRKKIYIDDYIGEEIDFLLEDEIKRKVIYLPNKEKVYILVYQAPYDIYANYLNEVRDSFSTLKVN